VSTGNCVRLLAVSYFYFSLFIFLFNFVVLRSYLSLDHLPYASGTCLLHFLMETACKFNVLNSIFSILNINKFIQVIMCADLSPLPHSILPL